MKFILYNLNPSEIDDKYNFTIRSNIDTVNISNKTTSINDISSPKNSLYSYYDQSKKHIKCSLTMTNLIGNKLPKQTNLHCHWCRSPFKTSPIGCPIKCKDDAYLVDGIFCSFNCCKAFIDDQKHNSIYKYSNHILDMMYYSIYNEYIDIKKAPNWKILTDYGGNKSIDQFRESFNSIEYINNNNYIVKLPEQIPISWIIGEHVIF